jgi:two-component system chemotaxis sensor kinase CheA
VERIETVSLDRIEYAGGRALLQYRGELLPLEDHGEMLLELERSQQQGEEVQATVLICGTESGRQRAGMVVRRVLDVSAGTLLDREASNREIGAEMELALVKEKLTLVRRHLDAGLTPSWREVA